MSNSLNRVPAGVSAGGQFAHGTKTEAAVSLDVSDAQPTIRTVVPTSVTQLRKALKNRDGEYDSRVERRVVVDFSNTKNVYELDAVGPKDGRALHVVHAQTFAPIHARSGTVKVAADSRLGNSVHAYPGADVTVDAGYGLKTSIDAQPGSKVTVNTQDGERTRVRLTVYEGAEVTINTPEGGPQPHVLFLPRTHRNHPEYSATGE